MKNLKEALKKVQEAPIGFTKSADTVVALSSDHSISFELASYSHEGGYTLDVKQKKQSKLSGATELQTEAMKKALVAAVEAFERTLRQEAKLTFTR